jgi:hypothetical protein
LSQGSVDVAVTAISVLEEPSRTQLDYEVRNTGDVSVWVVDDGWLVWRQSGVDIELSYARGRMRKGVEVFGYFPPVVAALDQDEAMTRTVELTWPLRLSSIWNTTSEARPAPGEYQATVRVGYGWSPDPDPPKLGESVEDPVLRWQQEAISPPFVLLVAPY